MNKKELMKLLEAFPYCRADYWVITGGAMVLYGIKDETADVDLGCKTALADELERGGYLQGYSESGYRRFKYGDSVEIFENWLCGSVTEVNGFPVITVEGLMEMKRELGREKDFRDIELINSFLKQPKHHIND